MGLLTTTYILPNTCNCIATHQATNPFHRFPWSFLHPLLALQRTTYTWKLVRNSTFGCATRLSTCIISDRWPSSRSLLRERRHEVYNIHFKHRCVLKSILTSNENRMRTTNRSSVLLFCSCKYNSVSSSLRYLLNIWNRKYRGAIG
jgi:hypothetical protein